MAYVDIRGNNLHHPHHFSTQPQHFAANSRDYTSTSSNSSNSPQTQQHNNNSMTSPPPSTSSFYRKNPNFTQNHHITYHKPPNMVNNHHNHQNNNNNNNNQSRSSMEQEQYLNLTTRVSKDLEKSKDRDSLLSSLRSSQNSNSSYRNSITHDTLGLSKSFAGILNNSEADKELREKCIYLQQLLKDKRHLTTFPQGTFFHLDRILDEGMYKFFSDKSPLKLIEK